MATFSLITGLTGAATGFAVPFEYLSKSHVYVYVNGVSTSFTWNSTYAINLSPAPSGTVLIIRKTPSDDAARSFTDGSVLLADDLNAAFLQQLYISQESADQAIRRGTTGHWDAGTYRLTNVPNPVNPLDAANKQWVESSTATAVSDAAASASSALSSKNAAASSASNAAGSAAAAAAYSTGLKGLYNYLINGHFDIWQRGTSQTAVGYGSADRWYQDGVGSTATASRQAFALGQTAVPGNPKYFMRVAVASVANAANYRRMDYRIENVAALAGKRITLTFWAMADAARNISTEFTQNFGAGGSPSATVTAIGVTKTLLSTSWAKYSYTVDIPAVSGKTLGTIGDYLGLSFWFDAGSNFASRTGTLGQQSGTFSIARVSVVDGDVTADADPAFVRLISDEINLCERFFCKSYALDTAPGTVTAVGSITSSRGTGAVMDFYHLRFRNRMRATPTVTYYSTASGVAGYAYSSSGSTDVDASTSSSTDAGFTVTFQQAANGVVAIQFAASAEL